MRHFVFLQGPLSPFYSHLSRYLFRAGHICTRVAFNGGDFAFNGFWGEDVPFEGKLSDWRESFAAIVKRKRVTDVVMYGDCRSYHRIAAEVAKENGLRVWVFEEGYLRPNYITLERDGVNANSPFVYDPKKAYDTVVQERSLPKGMMLRRSLYAAKYYLRKATGTNFAHYVHHRKGGSGHEAWCWLLSFSLKPYRVIRDRYWFKWKAREFADRELYFCPLQVHNDMQVKVHSSYPDVKDFITHVISSFHHAASPNAVLVFKHHPMDCGFRCYRRHIKSLSTHLGIQDRVVYGHEYRIPHLLRMAKGCVVINSTVGISSLIHGVPVKLMGRALYDGITGVFKGTLNEFWRTTETVNSHSRSLYLQALKVETQVSGSFYFQDEEMLSEICQRMVSTK